MSKRTSCALLRVFRNKKIFAVVSLAAILLMVILDRHGMPGASSASPMATGYDNNQAMRPEIKRAEIHPTTIVTAYYPLGNASKHTSAGYDEWMSNFFPCVKAPILIFLPSGSIVEKVKKMRGELPLTVKIMELWDMEPSMKFRKQFENTQRKLDPEKAIHSSALYAIWSSKSWMLKIAADENLYNSTYFFWADAGAWRGRQFPSWPDTGKLDDLYAEPTLSSRMLLASPMRLDSHQNGFNAGTMYIEGGFFGGIQSTIVWWEREYYRLLEEWIEKERFAGKDQELMTDISSRYPHRVIIIRSFDCTHGDPWFFFQPFLAERTDLNSEELSDSRINCSHILASPCIEYE